MPERTRLLIVDDEAPVRKSIASALEDPGYAIDTAASGEEAIKLDERNQYQIIITDLMMPGIGGMDLLRAVKKLRPGALVIMITGYPSVRTAVESIKHGAFDYLPKPFTPKEIRAIVARARARLELDATGEAPAPGAPAAYCIPENSWARIEDNGQVRVGVHRMFLNTVGRVDTIEFPEAGAALTQGQALMTITDRDGRSHRVWSPVTGTVTALNEELTRDITKLKDDPHGQGWVVKIKPSQLNEDLKSLLPMD